MNGGRVVALLAAVLWQCGCATTGSASFGIITSQINFARQLQFGLRLAW